MSETSQNEVGSRMPDATSPATEGGAETAASAIDSTSLEAAPPPDAALEELKTEVLSAVRGAITGVMNRHQPALPGPDLDLDFSLRKAESSAAELPPDIQQALAEAVAAADAADDIPTEESPARPPAIEDVDLTAQSDVPAGSEPKLETLDAPVELELPPSLVIESPPLSLVPSPSTGVPAVQVPYSPPPRRHWPAWTTAALLSVTGIAVGAGTATLIIEPDALGTLGDRVDSQLRSVFEVARPGPGAQGAPDGRDAAPTPTSTIAGSAEIETASQSATLEPAPAAAASTPPLAMSQTSTEADAAPLQVPQIEPLAGAVRVTRAHDAAALAHRLAKPLGASAAVLAGGRSSQLEALAALPPQATITVAPTGGELTPAPTGLAAEPTTKTDVDVAAAEPAPAPGDATDDSVATPAPQSALARARAALSRGDVDEARLVLQAESEAGQVEGMLLLARSYDPSYLIGLGLDPAKGKREIAERLYRAWYVRSVELGLVSASVNIDRLLKAMARAKP